MGDLIQAFYLLLYVGRFLAEQWRRRQSRDWPLTAVETAEGSIVSRRFPCLVAITYSYRAMGETYTGSLYRRCMRKQSALDLIDQASEPGVEARYHPEHHDRSYLPLPLRIGGFADQLAYIEDKLHSLGLPRPVSFAYPAYVSNAMAVGVLAQRGYQFARIGGARPYRPMVDNPLLIPSYSTSGDHPERIFAAFEQAKNGRIVVLTIHGVPDVAHPWVTTPPELFRQYLAWLYDHHYRVIAMRDLAKYIDPAKALAANSSTASAGAQ